MKKTNMYENVRTWNPLAGKCPHDCVYCSTKSFRYLDQIKKYSGELRLDEKAFKKNLGKGNTWFVCAQNDLFAGVVMADWIYRIINYCKKFDNTYLFQTKSPSSYKFFQYPDKSILGTTIESNRYYKDFYSEDTPPPEYRANSISIQKHSFKRDTFITIEPILDFDLIDFVELIKNAEPNYVNVGADSKKHHLPEPNKEKILQLIVELKNLTEVRIKPNLERLIK
jgi:DNA repair photolyase